MLKIEKKQTFFFCLALISILMGSAIYILFRPTSLLMFHWFDAMGLTSLIINMRNEMNGFNMSLPTWFIYSLPFALYVVAYLFFIKGIWWNSISLVRHVWFWCIPIVAIGSELEQSFYFIPGYFDMADLITILLGTAFVVLITEHSKINKREIA